MTTNHPPDGASPPPSDDIRMFVSLLSTATGLHPRTAFESIIEVLLKEPHLVGLLVRALHDKGVVKDMGHAARVLGAFMADASVGTPPLPTSPTGGPSVRKIRVQAEGPSAQLLNLAITSVTYDGTTTAASSWRQLFIQLVETVIAAGKQSDLPGTWFRAVKTANRKTETVLADGQLLYVNLDKVEQTRRAVMCATLLGGVVIGTPDGDVPLP